MAWNRARHLAALESGCRAPSQQASGRASHFPCPYARAGWGRLSSKFGAIKRSRLWARTHQRAAARDSWEWCALAPGTWPHVLPRPLASCAPHLARKAAAWGPTPTSVPACHGVISMQHAAWVALEREERPAKCKSQGKHVGAGLRDDRASPGTNLHGLTLLHCFAFTRKGPEFARMAL